MHAVPQVIDVDVDRVADLLAQAAEVGLSRSSFKVGGGSGS